MTAPYKYSLSECDVINKTLLESFRCKRQTWVDWSEDDIVHGLWRQLTSMVWAEVSFKALVKAAIDNRASPVNNTLLAEALIDGYVARQVLSIRRLVDPTKGNISIRRILQQLRSYHSFFTRENYVCFDGLPYDYNQIHSRQLEALAVSESIWRETEGPEAWTSSERAHEQFDRLSNSDGKNRNRDDHLPITLIDTLDSWLKNSGALEIASWSHVYLAHAGNRDARTKIADFELHGDSISLTIKSLARILEAISAYLLYSGGRSGSLMPQAQFDVFEHLEKPILGRDEIKLAQIYWQNLADERDGYLREVIDQLTNPKTTDKI